MFYHKIQDSTKRIKFLLKSLCDRKRGKWSFDQNLRYVTAAARWNYNKLRGGMLS